MGRKAIPTTVWILGLASFFTDFSSEMIYPLLPVFLSSVLGASAFELGIIEGIAETTASLLKVVSGVWTDRLQARKPIIVLGYSLSSLFRPLIGLASGWPFVLLLRFFDRIGKGLRSSPRDALIADVTDSHHRGAAYGLHRSMDHAGAVVGPLAASALLMISGMTFRGVFLLAAIPALFTLLILVLGIQEDKKKESEARAPTHPQSFSAGKNHLLSSWKRLGGSYRFLLFSSMIFTLGNSTDAFLLVRLSEAGISAGSIALLWSVHHVVKMISTYWGGRISDQLNRRTVILSGWLFYALIYIGFAVLQSATALVTTFLLYGLYYGLVEPAERAVISECVASPLRGTAFGIYHFTIGITTLPASVLFGWIWHSWGVTYAFLFGATLATMASVALSFAPKPAPSAT